MTLEEHEKIVDSIDINSPQGERLKIYKEELEKYNCTFDNLIFEDLNMNIKIRYNGNSLTQ